MLPQVYAQRARSTRVGVGVGARHATQTPPTLCGSSALLVNQSWTAPPARYPEQGEELSLVPPAYRPGYPAPHAPAAMAYENM